MTTRSVNPVPQYVDNSGNIVVSGLMYYFEAGTNIPLTTYADELKAISNAHPVPLDEAGRLPNVWFEGSAKQVLKATILGVPDTQIWERDPVGAANVTGVFSLYNILISYSVNDIVAGSDGLFYISLANANQGNDPVTPSPTKWSEFRLRHIYNASETYVIGDTIQDSTGDLWKSLTNPNTGNTPSTDSGTNWIPAVNGSKITAITEISTVIPHTGGGVLTALRVNELRDGNTGYTLPAASSISADQTITITLPVRYATGAVAVSYTHLTLPTILLV